MDANTLNVFAVVMATLIMGVPFVIPIFYYKLKNNKLYEFLFYIFCIIGFVEWILMWYLLLGVIW